MAEGSPAPITGLLAAWRGGDAAALDQLTPLIYRELRRLASLHLRKERTGHTLQPTALVHEAFLRLSGNAGSAWENRNHFFAIASHLMRQILIQHARAQGAQKRGGGALTLRLEDAGPIGIEQAGELLLLDEALNKLAEFDERKAKVLELRFFAGMTVSEVALVLGLGTATVERDLRAAIAWLRREMA